MLQDNKQVIALAATEAGGANVVFPLQDYFKKCGYQVLVFARGKALQKGELFNCAPVNVDTLFSECTYMTVLRWVKSIRPSIFITDANDQWKRLIWQACNVLGVPTIGLVDHWSNYQQRFLCEEKKIFSTPKYIGVIDALMKDELESSGVDNNIIVETGSPYFDFILERCPVIDTVSNKSFNSNDAVRIVFASESKDQGVGEKTLELLCNILERFSEDKQKSINLGVRLHPEDPQDRYQEIMCRVNQNKILACYYQDDSLYTTFEKFDIICGITSMFIIEASLIGKMVISIQVFNHNYRMHLERFGGFVAYTASELSDYINSVILRQSQRPRPNISLKNSFEEIGRLVKRELCQN